MLHYLKRAIAASVLLCTAFCGVSHAAVSNTAAQRRAEEERREFSSFIDGFLAGIQKEQRIPGMTFVAVRDGSQLYLKAYGKGLDGAPADPQNTLYRVGSVSKIMTAAAVLQLTARERIDLDENVNTYLRRWVLPGKSEEPVTMRHLLTHTGGFDDKTLEICAPTSRDERIFSSRLPKTMPAQYTSPGRSYSFSNMGFALAGSIVERYSRQNFAPALTRYIFEPLGMSHSSFAPSDALLSALAPGHNPDGSALEYTYRTDMPAMGMVSTAADMGRFMLAQFGEGVLGKNRILPAAHANSMLRRHFSPHPRIEGTGLAYLEKNVLGVRTLQQSGNIPGYSSFLMLVPEKKFGLFFTANIGGLNFMDDLADAVIRRFLTTSGDLRIASRPETAAHTEIQGDFEGWYRHNMVSRSTAEKARGILGPQVRIKNGGDRLLLETNRNSPAAETWAPTGEPDLFREISKSGNLLDSYLFFQRDEKGKIETMTVRNVNYTYDRLSKAEEYPCQMAQIGFFILTASVSLLGLLLGLAINRNRLPWEKGMRSATELWGLSTLFCFAQIAFAAGLLVASQSIGDQFATFVPYKVKALFILPVAAGILLAWIWFRLFANFLSPGHHKAEKLLLFILVCAETAYMFFLANWRLLGFMF